MTLTLILLALGFALVIKGGDLFVSSSISIAHHAKLPRVLIGATLVSLATTAPEMAVSATASIRGNPGLAIGNAVGSAIANIGLILGILCILRPMAVRPREFRPPLVVMLVFGLLLTAMTVPLQLRRTDGAILIACALGWLVADYIRHTRSGEGRADDVATVEETVLALRPAVLLFLLGGGLVVGGSRLLTDNAVKLATMLGVPPMMIGLTLVAIGTSLPELVTAITAARKGVPELSLGNVLGANILNVALITGTAGAIAPLRMSRMMQAYNFPAMLALFLLLLLLSYTSRRLSKREGVILLTFYALYVAGLIFLRE